jgi:hypothetical protein
VERILNRVRHQTAAIGLSAVVVLLWMAGVRAQDTGLLFAALGSIVAITVSVEFKNGKTYGQRRRKGEAESSNASSNKTVD